MLNKDYDFQMRNYKKVINKSSNMLKTYSNNLKEQLSKIST